MKTALTAALYARVCHSLFEKDKLLYAFSLACSLCQYIKGTILPEEYSFFLNGRGTVCKDQPNPTNWFPDRSWQEVLHAAARIPDLKDLPGVLRALSASGQDSFWSIVGVCS
jgi:dynein heavy chain